MFGKSLGVCLILLASASLGCAASTDDEHDDATTGAVATRLSPAGDGVAPPPFEPKMPNIPELDQPLGRPIWDIQRYIEEERRRPFEFSRCYQYSEKVYNPARGRDEEIPVTVCN